MDLSGGFEEYIDVRQNCALKLAHEYGISVPQSVKPFGKYLQLVSTIREEAEVLLPCHLRHRRHCHRCEFAEHRRPAAVNNLQHAAYCRTLSALNVNFYDIQGFVY